MENNEKTIYLHIGMPKTGSTSIQHFLYQNRKLLERKNILYPIFPEDLKEKYFLNVIKKDRYYEDFINFRGIYLYYSKIINQNRYADYEKAWQEGFLYQIKNSECPNIIFSEETVFESCENIDLINVFIKNNFKVKIILYVRKPAEYISSLWGQWVKPFSVFAAMSIKEFLDTKADRITDFKIVYDFINKLGKENIIIRPYEKEQWKDGNLYADFLSCVNCELTDEFIFPPRSNESYNRNLTEWSRLLNSLRMPRNKTQEVFKQISVNTSVEPKILESFSDDLISEITQKYISKYSELAELFGKKSFFLSNFPDCYKKEREPYNQVSLSLDSFEYILTILKNLKFSKEQTSTYDEEHNKLINIQKLLEKEQRKTAALKNAINLLEEKIKINKIPFYQKIFSVKEFENKKIVRILGLKLSFKNNKK